MAQNWRDTAFKDVGPRGMGQCVRVFWESSSRDGLIFFSLGTYTLYSQNTAVLKMITMLIHTAY